MPLRYEDLPPAVRRKVGEGREIVSGPVSARRPSDAVAVRVRTPGLRWRCCRCDETFTAFARAERHADTHGGARIEVCCY